MGSLRMVILVMRVAHQCSNELLVLAAYMFKKESCAVCICARLRLTTEVWGSKMSIGPKINYTKRNFTTRDNLGINAAVNSFQAELCPVINTVTPRAFYWVFAVWNYYDYWVNFKTSKRCNDEFENSFLKRNDYYFVLANLMVAGSDRDNLVGKDNVAADLENNPAGPYPYNRNYFVSHYGGMQYYIPGCTTLGFITSIDSEGNALPFPKITEKKGVPLALAFEKVIKNTEYYRSYRLNNTPIPRSVLEELGRAISLNMTGMDECKALLREAFFYPERNALYDNSSLILTKDFLLSFISRYEADSINAAQLREVLYDYYTPGRQAELPEQLRGISTAWEAVIGRQYFTLCLELIWKYMLMELSVPMDLNTWIHTCISDAKWTVDLSAPVESYLTVPEYEYAERESILAEGARSSKNVSKNLENALKVLFSINKRFSSRADMEPHYLTVGDNVSISEFIRLVEEYKPRPVSDLLVFIMVNWIVRRHEEVAFRKLVDGRDGFFIEKIDGKYYQKYISSADYTGNRMMQLIHVMDDLDMLV